MYQTFARAGAFARPVAGSYRVRASIQAALRSRCGRETKGVDTSLSLSPIISIPGTNASAFLLNAIAPGSGSFNRVGRKALLKSLRLKGAAVFDMTASASGIVPANSLRMVIVWDKQPNSSTIPTWDTIFGVTDQAGAETSTVEAPLRYDNMSRFQVLKDKTIDVAVVVANVVTTGVISQSMHFDEYISLSNRETTYSGQSATCTIADISTGALYVYFRAHNNTTNNIVTIDADTIARLRYTD